MCGECAVDRSQRAGLAASEGMGHLDTQGPHDVSQSRSIYRHPWMELDVATSQSTTLWSYFSFSGFVSVVAEVDS